MTLTATKPKLLNCWESLERDCIESSKRDRTVQSKTKARANKVTRLIFCEKTNWWATKFRQICGERELPVEETRLLDDLNVFDAPDADALIAIELNPDNIAQAAILVQRIVSSRSQCRCVALIRRDLTPCSTAIRGVGFIDVFTAPLELPRLARLTQRHLSLSPEQSQGAARLSRYSPN